MAGYVDLHCHVLPGVDDGPANVDESRDLILGLRKLGFELLVATPHVQPPRWDQNLAELRTRRDQLVKQLDLVAPRLEVAAENMFDDEVWRRHEEGTLICYPSKKAALVEFSASRPLPIAFEDRFFEMAVRGGVRPVLAHPERYVELCRDDTLLRKLVGFGTVLLVSLSSLGLSRGLLSGSGSQLRSNAELLVRQGLAQAVATDVHQASELKVVEKGMRNLRKLVGEERLEGMLVKVPRSLIERRP